jgi:hypothetical protein
MTEIATSEPRHATGGQEAPLIEQATYKCHRGLFTEEQYNRYATTFWMLPRAWGGDVPAKAWGGGVSLEQSIALIKSAGDTPVIAFLRHLGGAGLVSILPILGWLAGLEKERWALSAEELSRLCNVDTGSIRRARAALGPACGLSATPVSYTDQRHGRRLLHWQVPSCFAAVQTVRAAGLDREPYFFFSHRLIHGGQWAMLSAVQRAVYLAVATCAYATHGWADPLNEPLVSGVVLPGTPLDDMRRSQLVYEEHTLRVACVSYANIARISGYSPNAVKVAVRGFKHPAVWSRSTNDPRVLEYRPIWVYPTLDNGALLYHFRDHVRPWPWDVLNTPDRDSLCQAELAERLPTCEPLAMMGGS